MKSRLFGVVCVVGCLSSFSLIAHASKVFGITSSGTIKGFDTETGISLRKYTIDRPGISMIGALEYADGQLYAISDSGSVFSFDLDTGAVRTYNVPGAGKSFSVVGVSLSETVLSLA